ncbi:alpha/beta fold hydrolase [Streptomyces sp. NPDC056296]|uniref:alpha/beta fold hydrolase n=1 Tax=Streptomyces sp. NPDC056296 TaxID=3345775 RepID=UPI0035DF5DD0
MTDTLSGRPGPREEGWATRDGRRLHWTTTGSGEHTIVLEAGIAASSSVWSLIRDPVATFTRVVTYDRVGYGTGKPRDTTVEDALLDLEAVLEQSGAKGPLVLVGHSWGGVLMRLFTARHPDRVAALVLVDATHEGMRIMRSGAFILLSRIAAKARARKARTGALRRSLEAGRGELGRALSALPTALRDDLLDELSSPAIWHQSAYELRCVPSSLRSLPTARPDVSVIAVVGTQAVGWAERKARASIRAAYETWLPTVPNGRLLEASRSGHVVPLQDPELLVDTLRELVTSLSTDERGP